MHASLAVGAANAGVPVQFTVPFPPALPIVGGTLSIKVIVCDTMVLWLPQTSVASQLRVIVFAQLLPPVTSPRILTVAPEQASLAVGGTKFGVAEQLMVPFEPDIPMVGGVVSVTVIVCATVPL